MRLVHRRRGTRAPELAASSVAGPRLLLRKGPAVSGSPGRIRTSDQSVTPDPAVSDGGGLSHHPGPLLLRAGRWRALGGSLFFRHSLVSAPSLRPASQKAWLRVTICHRSCT